MVRLVNNISQWHTQKFAIGGFASESTIKYYAFQSILRLREFFCLTASATNKYQ